MSVQFQCLELKPFIFGSLYSQFLLEISRRKPKELSLNLEIGTLYTLENGILGKNFAKVTLFL